MEGSAWRWSLHSRKGSALCTAPPTLVSDCVNQCRTLNEDCDVQYRFVGDLSCSLLASFSCSLHVSWIYSFPLCGSAIYFCHVQLFRMYKRFDITRSRLPQAKPHTLNRLNSWNRPMSCPTCSRSSEPKRTKFTLKCVSPSQCTANKFDKQWWQWRNQMWCGPSVNQV